MQCSKQNCLDESHQLLGAGVLGDGLGPLRHGVLGELSREKQPDSGLDLTGSDGRPLVVVGEARGFSGEPLEDVVDERVHDGHGLGGDAGVGVHLLEHLVDVNGIRLLPLGRLLLLLVSGCLRDDGLGRLSALGRFSGSLGRHLLVKSLRRNSNITSWCLDEN